MKEKIKFYRNFGTLSDDSVVTDIYKKRYRKNIRKRKTKASKCITRKMTDDERRKMDKRR